MCQEGSRRSIPVLELQFPCVIGVGRESLAVPILMEMLESYLKFIKFKKFKKSKGAGEEGGGGCQRGWGVGRRQFVHKGQGWPDLLFSSFFICLVGFLTGTRDASILIPVTNSPTHQPT